MAERVNVQKSFSAVNESLARLFDESGVRRSFTVPYIEGQEMSDHVKSVADAAKQAGGLGANLIMTAHHSDGKGYGSGDGHTVGHGAENLRNTIVPKDDKNAKAVIDAAQTHLNNIGKLIGDDNPAVKTANSQLNLVKKTDAAGMNLFDVGVFITQILHPVNQAMAQAHDVGMPDGPSAKLRGHGGHGAAPKEGVNSDEDTLSGATEADKDTSEPTEGADKAAPAEGAQPEGGQEQEAPEAQAAPAGAPAAPQAQG